MSIIIAVTLTLPLLASLYAQSLQLVLGNPMIPAPFPPSPSKVFPGATAYPSYNWGGYAIFGPTGSVSDVKGSWTVPTYTGATCNANEWWAAIFFVGIDGFSSTTVEQTGTATQCYEGTVQYYAWYEWYPAASVIISSVPVSPGNTMSAEVKFSSGKFTASITDTTTGKSFTTPATKVSGAKENSAEWIAESPYGSIGELPLANFGTVYFTSATAVTTTHSGTIGTFPSANIAIITAVCYPSGAPTKSTTSGLTNSGANFNVAWLNPGPQG
jgi:hypothetical protein